MNHKSLFLGALFALAAPLAADYHGMQRSYQQRDPRENINIYNENNYPSYGSPYGGYGYYYGYPMNPEAAFPDDEEAEYLFEKMNR